MLAPPPSSICERGVDAVLTACTGGLMWMWTVLCLTGCALQRGMHGACLQRTAVIRMRREVRKAGE